MGEPELFVVPTTVITLFEHVAGLALASGREFRLEVQNYKNDRAAFGTVGVNNTDNKSLTLLVFGPDGPREEDDDDAGSADQGGGGEDPDGE